MVDKRITYWMERITQDSDSLGDDKKLELAKSYISTFSDISCDELDVFFSTNPRESLDSMMDYALVERKIAEFFGGEAVGGNDIDQKREEFISKLKTLLSDIYSPTELTELTSYMKCWMDDNLVFSRLVGRKNPIMRKIRNAYLPEISNLIVIDTRTGGSKDITHTLFDGDEEACDQIDRILGIDANFNGEQ